MTDLGLSNPYLKFGLGLVVLSLFNIVTFAVTSNYAVLYAAGIFFWSGVIVYIGGRIAKARRPGRDA